MTDVLRLALPPRARPRRRSGRRRPADAPARPARTRPGSPATRPAPALLDRARRGAPRRGRSGPRCPGEDWPTRLAELCQAALSGRPRVRSSSSPTARTSTGWPPRPTRLLPAALVHRAARRRRPGQALPPVPRRLPRRAPRSCWAPAAADVRARSRDLGLVVVWDDGDDLHAESPAPYPHARDVLVQRAHLADCAAVVAGTARTAEAALLVESGWAHELVADRAALRAAAPRVQALGDDFELARDPAARSARLPTLGARGRPPGAGRRARRCWCRCRARGYVPSLACARCRAPARCAHCAGPLGISPRPGPGGARIPACRWCARPAATFDCPHCHGTKLRAAVVGASRTAEELARAFPGRRGAHLRQQRPGVLATVPGGPGARRRHAGRRAGRRGRLRRGAAARLLGAARPGRPAGRGGDAAPLDERRRAGAAGVGRRAGRRRRRRRAPRRAGAGALGPGRAGRARAGRPPRAGLPAGHPDGRRCRRRPAALAEFLAALRLPEGADVLGPVPEPPRPGQEGERERYLVRVPRTEGAALAHALPRCRACAARRRPPSTSGSSSTRSTSSEQDPAAAARPACGGSSWRAGTCSGAAPARSRAGRLRSPR